MFFGKTVHLSPARMNLIGFALLILVGTGLLMLPISTNSPGGATFLDALFTATSATCVTGLVVHDTALYWTPFGQAVILILIQIGGSHRHRNAVRKEDRIWAALGYAGIHCGTTGGWHCPPDRICTENGPASGEHRRNSVGAAILSGSGAPARHLVRGIPLYLGFLQRGI